MVIYKFLLILAMGLNVLAQMLLKKGMQGLDILFSEYSITHKAKDMVLNPFFWLAIFSYGISFIVYSVVLSKMNLSTAYPVTSVLTIIVIYSLSLFYLHEPVSLYGITGLTICVIGVLLLLK